MNNDIAHVFVYLNIFCISINDLHVCNVRESNMGFPKFLGFPPTYKYTDYPDRVFSSDLSDCNFSRYC